MNELSLVLRAGAEPWTDRRVLPGWTLSYPHSPPRPASRAEWARRAAWVRRRIRLAGGLLPEPERAPLKARRFGAVAGDGYRVEKAWFASGPGFLCAGSLFLPAAGRGPFPGVLCPHGHLPRGRLQREYPRGGYAVLARSAALARLGFVVFAYDMVGYNDCPQFRHRPPHALDDQAALWSLDIFSRQLLNSVRALDFLQSLPEVRADRIGCTGASGGGTQTMMLAAIDERVRCAAPVCMVSAHFQGGCNCEHGAGLHLDGLNNLEVAGAIAPRPLLLVSATGDWTSHSPAVEFPALKRIYRLYGAGDRVALAHFDAPHNYNRRSREAMYAWFVRHLKGKTKLDGKKIGQRLAEPPVIPSLPDDDQLRVFPGSRLPAGFERGAKARRSLLAAARAERARWPVNGPRRLKAYRDRFSEAYHQALAVTVPGPADLAVVNHRRRAETIAGRELRYFLVSRRGVSDGLPVVRLAAGAGFLPDSALALVVSPGGKRCLFAGRGAKLSPLAQALTGAGLGVAGVDVFLTGELAKLAPLAAKAADIARVLAFRRTELAERVQDVVTAAALAVGRWGANPLHLVGLDEAGIWVLLARPFLAGLPLGAAAADLGGWDGADDGRWARRFFVPHLRRAGDLVTACALAAPGPLLLSRAKAGETTKRFGEIYRAAGAAGRLRLKRAAIGPAAIARFLATNGREGIDSRGGK